ncbi:DUF4279 domain-containing protein [Peptostreptococcaceae bacterium AGR-M142]
MAKVTVCFCISTEKDMDMDMFTKKLGIIPTDIFKKTPSKPFSGNEWSLEIKKENTIYANDVAKELLNIIYPKLEILKSLQSRYNHIEYSLVYLIDPYEGEKAKIIIDKETMMFAKEINADLMIDQLY